MSYVRGATKKKRSTKFEEGAVKFFRDGLQIPYTKKKLPRKPKSHIGDSGSIDRFSKVTTSSVLEGLRGLT